MRELLVFLFLKWYTVRMRTQLGIYSQIYPFALRSSLGLRPWELLQGKGIEYYLDITRQGLISPQSCPSPFYMHHQSTSSWSRPLSEEVALLPKSVVGLGSDFWRLLRIRIKWWKCSEIALNSRSLELDHNIESMGPSLPPGHLKRPILAV